MSTVVTERLTRRPATVSAGVELAARSSDGFEVALFWARGSGELWVDVLHVPTGESFRIPAPAAHALDAYYHPFAYLVDA